MDTQILLAINRWSSPLLDQVMLFVTIFGGVPIVLLAVFVAMIVLCYLQRWRAAIFVAGGVGGALLITLLLKIMFARIRPELWDLITSEYTYSFPSVHATLSSALASCAVMLSRHTKWRRHISVVAVIYVISIGFSRLYLGVHYPTDVLGGWIVAVLWVLTWAYIIGIFRPKFVNHSR